MSCKLNKIYNIKDLLENPEPKCILVVLPRKLSVIASATRVASELQSPIGSVVGYSLRMDSKISSQTRIKFITYKSFLREVQLDPRSVSYTHLTLPTILRV